MLFPKLKNTFFFVCCFILHSTFAQAPFSNFDSYVQAAMIDWQIPGMSLAVVKEGKIVYAKGYGIKNIIFPNEKVDENTIFAIGSNTKAFTATALALLQQERKLGLDDKVRRYFPTFEMEDKYAAQEMSIRDLLTHRIGIATWNGDFTHWGSKYSKEELIQKMKYLPTASSLRTRFGYCNIAYMLAGEVIPKVTKGDTWEMFLKERFFEPLQMSRTCTSTHQLPSYDNVAMPHTLYRNNLVKLPWRNIDNLAACGSINSTAIDMSHWLIMQMDSGRYAGKMVVPQLVLTNTHIPQFAIPAFPYNNPTYSSTHFAAYGLGWFLNDYQGNMLIHHAGAVDGMVSQTAFMPEKKIGLVILTNSDAHNFTNALMYQILDAYLGSPFKDWNKEALAEKKQEAAENEPVEAKKNLKNKHSLPIEAYTGYYLHPHYGQMAIRLQNKELVVTPSAHPGTTGKLLAWNGDDMMCEWSDLMWDKSLFHFSIQDDKVKFFEMTTRPDLLDPMTYLFEKME